MNIAFTLRYSYSPQAFCDTFTREFSPEVHKGKLENDWWVYPRWEWATSVFVITKALSFVSLFTYFIKHIYRFFLSHFFYINFSQDKAWIFLGEIPLVKREYFYSYTQNILLIISIHTYTHLFLFRARIHLLLQFLTRLNSNFLLIVTHDRTKRSGTFAGALLQTNIFLLTYPACRSNLPRAETWNVTYSNTSLDPPTHVSTDRKCLTRDRIYYHEDIITKSLLLYVSSNYISWDQK